MIGCRQLTVQTNVDPNHTNFVLAVCRRPCDQLTCDYYDFNYLCACMYPMRPERYNKVSWNLSYTGSCELSNVNAGI